MKSPFGLRLALWKKRREIARIDEHLLWLKENQEFVRLQIPRYEAELRRQQAKLFLMEPAHRSLQLQPRGRRLPAFEMRLWLGRARAWAQLASRAVLVAWRDATSPALRPVPMRRSALSGRRV